VVDQEVEPFSQGSYDERHLSLFTNFLSFKVFEDRHDHEIESLVAQWLPFGGFNLECKQMLFKLIAGQIINEAMAVRLFALFQFLHLGCECLILFIIIFELLAVVWEEFLEFSKNVFGTFFWFENLSDEHLYYYFIIFQL
jgi:hypothetical protein